VATGGEFISYGKDSIIAKGVVWATTENPTLGTNFTMDGVGSGDFASSITGLTPMTYYFIRAYATTKGGTTVYGTQVKFITSLTPVSLPYLTTTAFTNVTNTSASSGGTIVSDSGTAVTARGVCWSTVQSPTIADAHTSNGTGIGTFLSTISPLLPTTTYYVRAYATNAAGTGYGNELTLGTSNVTSDVPTVTTKAITNVTSVTAYTGGNVTNMGGTAVLARGVCWSTSPNPDISGAATINGTGVGPFNSSASPLLANTTYYLRAYATNSAGTGYGAEMTFHTMNAVPPTLITYTASAITATSANSGGNISSDGGAAVTARGVCWNTTGSPTIGNSKTTDGPGSGGFTSALSGLVGNTTYYIRSYATNSAGTSYGNELTFMTLPPPGLPNLITTAITSITSNGAAGGGTVTSDGGTPVTAYGICWSTNANPTLSNSKTVDGSGTGSFTSILTGLNANTTYYVRAYATNSTGTAYGNQVTFTTSPPPPVCGPTVTDADGNTYNAVQVGLQCWMKENLKTTKFANGNVIPVITDNATWGALTTGAYCYYENNSSNAAAYGALYNWYAVTDSRNVCPAGWHVPTQAEFTTLINNLGGTANAGAALKEAGNAHWIVGSAASTNSSNFTALPGSYRFASGGFAGPSSGSGLAIGSVGFWWSTTPQGSSISYYMQLIFSDASATSNNPANTGTGASVRCLKN
jgi:uncharacterized protein (TIGR02145 family)